MCWRLTIVISTRICGRIARGRRLIHQMRREILPSRRAWLRSRARRIMWCPDTTRSNSSASLLLGAWRRFDSNHCSNSARGAELFRARCLPIARFAATAHGAGHRIAVHCASVIKRDACGDVELDVVAINRADDRAGLAWAFECAGDLATLLRESHGLIGVAGVAGDVNGPAAGDIRGLVLSGGCACDDSEKNK